MANILTGDQDDNFLYGTWQDDILRGLDGNDFLMGAGGNDTLEGGKGNDRLENLGGNNTYLFGRGDGQDEILAWDPILTKHNTIRFGEGIAPGDIVLERLNDSLVLRVAGTTDSITVINYFINDWNGSRPYAIEEVRFFDGASWDSLAILSKVNPPIALDDDANFFGGGSVDGKGGNDQLYGSWNDDVMRGGDGNDKLRSMDGDDFLTGGAGDDLLDGGRGVNTMLFAQGWGHDTIILIDMDVPAGTIIEIAGALPGTLLLSRSDDGAGNDLIISAKGASDTITVAGYFDQNYASAASTLRISYADGSVWNYDQIQQATWPMPPVFEQIGTEGNDWLQYDWGNSHLVGAGGDDQIYGGQGADALDGGEGMDNLVGSYGDDLLDGGAGDDTLQGDQGNDVLLGGDGDDQLRGGDGDDILDAGAGNANLDGGDGNNLILFGRSAGEYRLLPSWNGINTIVLASDVRPEDIRVTSYNPWEVSVEIKGSMARILMPLVSD